MKAIKREFKQYFAMLLAVCMLVTSSFQGIAFAEPKPENIDVLLRLNGEKLREEALKAIRSGSVYENQWHFQMTGGEVDLVEADDYSAVFDQSTGEIYELASIPYEEFPAEEEASPSDADKASSSDAETASPSDAEPTELRNKLPDKAELKLFVKLNGTAADIMASQDAAEASEATPSGAESDREGYELQGDEQIIFLFINGTESELTFQVEVDGTALPTVVVESKEALIPSVDDGPTISGGASAGGAGGSGSGAGSADPTETSPVESSPVEESTTETEEAGTESSAETDATEEGSEAETPEQTEATDESNAAGETDESGDGTGTESGGNIDESAGTETDSSTDESAGTETDGNTSESEGTETETGGSTDESTGSEAGGNTDENTGSEAGGSAGENAGNEDSGSIEIDTPDTGADSDGGGNSGAVDGGNSSTSGETEVTILGSADGLTGRNHAAVSAHRVNRVMAVEDDYETGEVALIDDIGAEESDVSILDDEMIYNEDVEIYSDGEDGSEPSAVVFPSVVATRKRTEGVMRRMLRMAAPAPTVTPSGTSDGVGFGMKQMTASVMVMALDYPSDSANSSERKIQLSRVNINNSGVTLSDTEYAYAIYVYPKTLANSGSKYWMPFRAYTVTYYDGRGNQPVQIQTQNSEQYGFEANTPYFIIPETQNAANAEGTVTITMDGSYRETGSTSSSTVCLNTEFMIRQGLATNPKANEIHSTSWNANGLESSSLLTAAFNLKKGGASKAVCTNVYDVPSLIISKKVNAPQGYLNGPFGFDVTIRNGGIHMVVGEGAESVAVPSDTVFPFTLSDGESVEIKGIDRNATYEITEHEYTDSETGFQSKLDRVENDGNSEEQVTVTGDFKGKDTLLKTKSAYMFFLTYAGSDTNPIYKVRAGKILYDANGNYINHNGDIVDSPVYGFADSSMHAIGEGKGGKQANFDDMLQQLGAILNQDPNSFEFYYCDYDPNDFTHIDNIDPEEGDLFQPEHVESKKDRQVIICENRIYLLNEAMKFAETERFKRENPGYTIVSVSDTKYENVEYTKVDGTKAPVATIKLGITCEKATHNVNVKYYNKLAYGQFAIEKQVVGDEQAKQNQYSFDVQLQDGAGRDYNGIVSLVQNGQASMETPVDGKLTVKLSDGERVSFTVPAGVKYTISESPFDDGAYATTNTKIQDENNQTLESVENQTVSAEESKSYTFTNTVEPYKTLKVEKNVVGATGGTYPFTISPIVKADGTPLISRVDGKAITDGKFDVTVGQPVEFKVSPIYTDNFTIKEENQNGAWKTTVKVGDAVAATGVFTETAKSGDTVTFTNYYYQVALEKELDNTTTQPTTGTVSFNLYDETQVENNVLKADAKPLGESYTFSTNDFVKMTNEGFVLSNQKDIAFNDIGIGTTKEFYLAETSTMPGYEMLTDLIHITVSRDVNGTLTCTVKADDPNKHRWAMSTELTTDYKYVLRVTNYSGVELPETGGMGLLLWDRQALLLMMLAIMGLGAEVLYRRRRSEDEAE